MTDHSMDIDVIKQEVGDQLNLIRESLFPIITPIHKEAINVIDSVKSYINKIGNCDLCKDLTITNGNLNGLTIITPNKTDRLFRVIDYLICPCGFMKILSTLNSNNLFNVKGMSYTPHYYSVYSKVYLTTCYRILINVNYLEHVREEQIYYNSLFSNVVEAVKTITNLNIIMSNLVIEEKMDMVLNTSPHNRISLDFRRFNKINEDSFTGKNLYYIFEYLMFGTPSRHIKFGNRKRTADEPYLPTNKKNRLC